MGQGPAHPGQARGAAKSKRDQVSTPTGGAQRPGRRGARRPGLWTAEGAVPTAPDQAARTFPKERSTDQSLRPRPGRGHRMDQTLSLPVGHSPSLATSLVLHSSSPRTPAHPSKPRSPPAGRPPSSGGHLSLCPTPAQPGPCGLWSHACPLDRARTGTVCVPRRGLRAGSWPGARSHAFRFHSVHPGFAVYPWAVTALPQPTPPPAWLSPL